MKRILVLLLCLAIFETANAQTWADTVTIITKLFNRYQPDKAGCQLSISRNGQIVFSKAWGLADLEHNVPYTTETVTEAGSITKQFTAAAILLLEQQGKLSLNDDVRKYIPELPDYGTTIKLSHLLHHTSGLREWSSLEAITGWPRTFKAYNNQDVLATLCRQKRLNNIPGAEYIYSNSNYLLLGLIVERLTGMTLPEFTKENIFKPAGMTHTQWRDNFKKVVPNRGIAYIKKGDRYEINMPNENVYGPGALLTTADDLIRWTNYFLSNKLGNPGLKDKQLALEPIVGGAEPNYAAGLFIGKFRGLDVISHTGQTAGYLGAVETLPALHLTVAWLSNTMEFRDSLFVGIDAIDNLFIKNGGAAPAPKIRSTTLVPVTDAKKYAGWYRSAKTNKGTAIVLQHDTLLIGSTPLIPVGEKDFRYGESNMKFNAAVGFIITTSDKEKTVFTKETKAPISAAYLKSFTGTYYSKETESSFKIIVKDGKLMLDENYLKDVALSPMYKNSFNTSLVLDTELWPVDMNILFELDNKGVVKGCSVSMSNARGMQFVKSI